MRSRSMGCIGPSRDLLSGLEDHEEQHDDPAERQRQCRQVTLVEQPGGTEEQRAGDQVGSRDHRLAAQGAKSVPSSNGPRKLATATIAKKYPVLSAPTPKNVVSMDAEQPGHGMRISRQAGGWRIA